MALSSTDSGKIWVGKISWISSKPIEVRFLIDRNKSAEGKGHSATATFNVGKNGNIIFASTNLTGNTPQQIFGNLDFVVDQLVFHSINNTKFTVTYAIDAGAKVITRDN